MRFVDVNGSSEKLSDVAMPERGARFISPKR